MLARAKDLSVVLLKDGREGTVVSVYDQPGKPLAYLLELADDEADLVTVLHEEVQAVTWSPES